MADASHHMLRGRADQRAARERAAVVARLHRIRHRLRAQQSADGQSRRQRLGERHDVGRYARPRVAPQRPGAAQAALHLVEDEQCASGVAQLTQSRQKGGVGTADAALALHRLNQHCGGAAAAHQTRGARQVSECSELGAWHQRLERLAVALLQSGVQRA